MAARTKIKVIKKGEKKIAQNSAKLVEIQQNSKKEAAREMVSTVTNWVTDFQQRKRDETRQAFEKFFTQQPQTSGA